MMIEEKRVTRHIREICKMNPSPLADVKQHIRNTVSWMRVNASHKTSCPKCLCRITATEKTTMAKAIGTHLSKHHRNLSSRKRDKIRRKIFRHNYVLVAKDVRTAVATGLKLDSKTYDKVAKSCKEHGTSRAQATASTREESREEHVLRNSAQLHPEPHELFLVRGLFAETANLGKSTMSFLTAIEREMDLDVLDWRYVFGVTEMRRLVRKHLSDTFEKSADAGYMRATCLRKFVKFVRGHLAEIPDGEDWRPLIEMTRELIEAVIKENGDKVTKARGRTRGPAHFGKATQPSGKNAATTDSHEAHDHEKKPAPARHPQ